LELAGSLGDLDTLLPFAVAMVFNGLDVLGLSQHKRLLCYLIRGMGDIVQNMHESFKIACKYLP
jgi:hypothetical protein